MDFLDPQKKRAHQIRLYVGYCLFAVLIGGVTLILWLQAYGFNVDLKTGDITQNGILFLDAHPEPAQVLINGEKKGTTDRRLILPTNNYEVELRRDGYRTWRSKFFLQGGTIERLIYPFLFPEKLETKDTQLYAAAPLFAAQSPNKQWLIISQPNDPLKLELTNVEVNPALAVQLALPEGLINRGGSTHQLQLVEWASDNRHILLKHTFDGGVEYVLIDREQPFLSANLTKLFAGTSFSDISLRDKKFNRYYLFDKQAQSLKTANLDGAIVTPLLEKVLQYKPHGANELIYITTADAKGGRVLAKVRDDGRDFVLKDFPADSAFLIDIARFNNSWYMAAGAANDQRIYIYKNPATTLRRSPAVKLIPATILRLENPQFASFSTNARFLAVQSGSKFSVYDAEMDRNFRYDTGLEVPAGIKAVWMDGHRLTLVSKGVVEVFDFDGTNKQALIASHANFTPYFEPDYSTLFTIGPSTVVKGRSALLQTELLVKPKE